MRIQIRLLWLVVLLVNYGATAPSAAIARRSPDPWDDGDSAALVGGAADGAVLGICLIPVTGSFLAIPIAAAAGGFTSVAFHEIAKAVHLSETDKAIVEAALLAGSLGVCAGGAAFLPKGVKMADLGVARVASPFNKLVGNRFAGTVKGMKVGGGIGAIGGAAGAWFAERRRQAFGH